MSPGALRAGSHPWLAPLGALFGAGAAVRVGLYRRGVLRSQRLTGPVISVGNLAVGGSGKTPVVARIASLLRDQGLPVAILSRGYRGTFRGECLVVSDGDRILEDAVRVGDEPVMLARDLPGVVVAVGRRRDVVGRVVEARFGRCIHVLDDGFQHLRLGRDLDVLCLDPADLTDRPLPAGRLREWPAASARAQVLLVPPSEGGPRVPLAVGQRLFRVRRRVLGFFDREGVRCAPPRRPFLVSGIARPERFAADVRAEIGTLAGHAVFPDHHAFSASDLGRVDAEARAGEADALVTTAKDAVRLPVRETGLPVLVLRIAAEVEDEAGFRECLLGAVRSAASSSPAIAPVETAPAAARNERREARHRREVRAANVVSRLVRLLPRRAALAIGRGLGRLLADLDRRHVAIAADNLRQAFPHWDEARVLRTAHAVYAHFGQVLLDILWLEGRTREELLALTEPVGFEHPRAIQSAGRGIVLVGAHLGNWEVHGIGHGLLCGSIGVVARPLDNPDLDRRLCSFRTAWGNAVIYKQRALAEILRTVRGGGTVAILVDQNVQEKDGIFVPFFGRPAASTTVAAAIAVKTGCAIVPARTELLPNGRYRLKCEPPLEWSPTEDRQADIARLTARLAQVIESWVRETPEQWLWMHRRWKTQPTHTTPRDPAVSEEEPAIASDGPEVTGDGGSTAPRP